MNYILPNESELQWSALIVLYPFITGLVAGAFILASLVRVFHADALKPAYRLALLTALAFMFCAPLPLVAHLGHPERSLQIMMTPHTSSAMAMFGFVYLWYLLVVLLLEIWFDFRKEIVVKALASKGLKRIFYKVLALGLMDTSEKALEFDEKAGRFITIIGIPSAVLLHGYVGFIFGSIKANPWWSSVLTPVIFLLSAIVSGIAMVLLLYIVTTAWRKKKIDTACVAGIGRYLMFALIFDLTLEVLDITHRMYEAGEWFEIMQLLNQGYLIQTMFVGQLFLGAVVPLVVLGIMQIAKMKGREIVWMHGLIACLVLVGVFLMRWNVVIGGQLFSKSLHGLTTFRLHLAGQEGLLVAGVVLALPFALLWVLSKILPPWEDATESHSGA